MISKVYTIIEQKTYKNAFLKINIYFNKNIKNTCN